MPQEQKNCWSSIVFTHHCSLAPANEVCEGIVFIPVCHSVRGGGGQVGFPTCITGHMTGESASREGGGSTSRGFCIQRGLHSRDLHRGGGLHSVGFASRGVCTRGICIGGGVCMQGGVGQTPPGYYGIRSMSRRCAFFWNGFLLTVVCDNKEWIPC